MLEKELVVLHLKVSWRSCPGVRSGLGLWNNMQDMPFQSLALTAWASTAMLGEVWKDKEQWILKPLNKLVQRDTVLDGTDQGESLRCCQTVHGDLLEAGDDAGTRHGFTLGHPQHPLVGQHQVAGHAYHDLTQLGHKGGGLSESMALTLKSTVILMCTGFADL